MTGGMEFGIRITGDGRAFIVEKDRIVRGLDDIKRHGDSAGGGVRSLLGSLDGLARIAAGGFIGGALVQQFGQAARAILDAQIQTDKLRQVFTITSGTVAGAREEMGYVRAVANRLGIEVNSAANAYAKLSASARGTALEGGKTRAIFEAVAQASAKLGLSVSETDGALLAITQMISKGTVSAEELRGQLGERLPGAFQVAARAMGVTTAELGTMLEQGSILAEDFLPKFAAALQDAYAGPAMKTAQAELNRLANAWTEFKTAVADSGIGDATTAALAQMTEAIRGATRELQEWKRFGEVSAENWYAGFMGRAGILAEQFGRRTGNPIAFMLGMAARGQGVSAASNVDLTGDAREAGRLKTFEQHAERTAAALVAAAKPSKEYLALVRDLAGVSADFAKKLAVLNAEFERQGGAADPENLKRYRAEVAELIRTETDLGKALAKRPAPRLRAENLTDDVSAMKRAYDEAQRSLERMRRAQAEWADDQRDAQAAAMVAVRAYEEQTAAIGATTDELEKLALAQAEVNRNRNALAMGEVRAEEVYQREIAAIRDRFRKIRADEDRKATFDLYQAQREAAEMAEETWRQTAESIGDTITDALMRGFEGGKDAARNMRDTLANLFRTLVLRPVIQAIMAPVAGAVGGLFNGGAAAAGGGIPGLASQAGQWGLSSLFGGGGGSSILGALGMTGGGVLGVPGGTLGSFAVGGIGEALGLSVGMGNGAMALTAAGTAFTAVAAALPYIGIALALASALGVFDRGGPKTGGFAGNAGAFGERFFTPDQQDSTAASLRESTNRSIREVLRSLGSSSAIDTAFGFDQDPEGDAGSRVRAGLVVNGRVVRDTGNIDVGRDESAVQARLELEAKRTLLVALQNSEMPAQLARLFAQLNADSATAGQIDTIVKFGAAMRDALEAAKPGVADDAAKAYEAATQSSTARLRAMGAELGKLAGEQDGTIEKMTALSQATVQYRQAVTETLVAIRQIGAAVQAMIGQTRETIEFAGLDNQAAYDLARTRGNSLAAQIAATEDPAEVQQLAERVNAYLLQAFNLLSPEEQLARKPEFLAGLAALDEAVSAALSRIGTTIEGETADPFAAVNTALEAATVKFEDAADTQASAASSFDGAVTRFEAAVDRLERVPIGFVAPTPATSEVGA